jgi:hypothetical protein
MVVDLGLVGTAASSVHFAHPNPFPTSR